MKSFLSIRPRVATPGRPEIASESAAALARMNQQTGGGGEHAHGGSGAQVECLREGDRVSRIVVTCGCGERIEIDCLYAAGNG